MECSVLLLVCGVIYLADITEELSIENCNFASFIDIRGNTENILTCRDFDADSTINWWINRRDTTPASEAIATCTTVNCTLYKHDQFTVQRSPQESQLVYRQQDRTKDIGAQIVCESVAGGEKREASCRLNVISPAILSGCVVEEDRDKGTVNGSCHFEHAYSTHLGYICTWYQTKSSDQSKARHIGHVNLILYMSKGQRYLRGHCNLSLSGQHWNDGYYSYTIDFYPGPGPQSVPVGTLTPRITTTPTPGQPSTPHFGQPSTSTSTGDKTTLQTPRETTTSAPGPSSTPTSTGAPQPATRDDDDEGEEAFGNSVVFAVAGVTLAVVIVVDVVVIVAIVVWLRRRQWILPCAGKRAGPTFERRSIREPAQANGERRERHSEIYEIPDTPRGNSRRTHLRDNSPATVTPTGDNSPTTERSQSPAGDNSPTTERSQSPTGENSSTTVNNPLQTGDNSPANNYESLRTSDMGLRSVYSALAGPDYYNTGFAAGGAGDSTGGETSSIYENRSLESDL